MDSSIFVPPEYTPESLSQEEQANLAQELDYKKFEIKLREKLETLKVDEIRAANREGTFDQLLQSKIDEVLVSYSSGAQEKMRQKFDVEEAKAILSGIEMQRSKSMEEAFKNIAEVRGQTLDAKDVNELAASVGTGLIEACGILTSNIKNKGGESPTETTKKTEDPKCPVDNLYAFGKQISSYAKDAGGNFKDNLLKFGNAVTSKLTGAFGSVKNSAVKAGNTVISGLVGSGILTGTVGGGTLALGPVGILIIVIAVVTLGVVLTLIGAILGTYLIIKRNPHVQGMAKAYYMSHGFALGWFYVIYYMFARLSKS